MKADLHVHTTFSDGHDSPEEIVQEAIKKGISCLAITDHNVVKGAIRAMHFAFDKDILIIPGIEISTKLGHILGINVKRPIPKGLAPEEAVRAVRRQGGLSFLAHPFDWPVENFRANFRKIKEIAPDGIEVFNASVIFPISNVRAYRFAKENDFLFTAGSDAHRKEFIGRAYLKFSRRISSAESLLEAIRNKEAKPEGKALNWWEIFKMLC